MSNDAAQVKNIPVAPKPERFGPFTSIVSFVAMAALAVVLGVVIFG
jgi:hypothetical protein